MTEDEMVGWHHRLNGHEFEQTLGDSEGQGSLVCCSPCGCKVSDVTEQHNNFLPSEAFVLHHNILERSGPLPFYRASCVIKTYRSATGMGLPWCSVVKNLPANAGDRSSIPGPGRFHMPLGI